MGRPRGESSAVIRERVRRARLIQTMRFQEEEGSIRCNAEMGPSQIERHCALDEMGKAVLRLAIHDLNLSARAYHRLLRVARTIADLEAAEEIGTSHITEAVQYRTLDRQMW